MSQMERETERETEKEEKNKGPFSDKIARAAADCPGSPAGPTSQRYPENAPTL